MIELNNIIESSKLHLAAQSFKSLQFLIKFPDILSWFDKSRLKEKIRDCPFYSIT